MNPPRLTTLSRWLRPLTVAAPLALVTFSGSRAGAQLRFEIEVEPAIVIGSSCWAADCLVRGDVDGDGLDDLIHNLSVLGAPDWAELELLLSSHTGLVEGPRVNTGLLYAEFVAAGDVDADGAPDIVCRQRSRSGSATLLRGDGAGGFRSPVRFATVSDHGLALADLDQDGYLDAITATTVLLGGPEGLVGGLIQHAGDQLGPVADLDGDGALEVCVWRRFSSTAVDVTLFEHTGGGELVERHTMRTASPPRFALDLDGDGSTDLVLGDSMVAGSRDGGFEDPVVLPVYADAFDDFDGDGSLDILGRYRSYDGRVESRAVVSLNDGAGNFGTPIAVVTGATAGVVLPLDADADGFLDVVAAGSGALSVVRGDGTGAFPPPPAFTVHPEPRRALPPGPVRDYDRDGHLDLAFLGGFFLGAGDGSFVPALADAVVPGLGAWAEQGTWFLGVADLDGNGRDDFVRVAYPGLEVLWAEPDGTFAPAAIPHSVLANETLVVADFDGDGRLDLATTADMTVAVFANLGDRRFEDPRIYDIPNKMFANLMAGDFNGDGAADLLVLYDGTKILFNNGDGTFRDDDPLFLDREWPVAVGDFDEDGADDLFYHDGVRIRVAEPLTGVVTGFGTPGEVSGGQLIELPQWHTLRTVADLNGDRHLDLVLQGALPPELLFIEGRGDGSLGEVTRAVAPFAGFDATLAGDFDEDGLADLAGLTGEGALFLKNLGIVPQFRRGEINGDGKFDLVDAVAHLSCLFHGPESCSPCPDAQDVNDDGQLDISDGVWLLSWLYLGSAEPREPFQACGRDPTPDALECAGGDSACR